MVTTTEPPRWDRPFRMACWRVAGRIPVLHGPPGRMIASKEESEVATDEPCFGAIASVTRGIGNLRKPRPSCLRPHRPAHERRRRAGCMSVASERAPAGSPEVAVSPEVRVSTAGAAAAALERAVAHLRSTRPTPAGGRASSRRTSRWTPRTSCCANSSASARRGDRGGRPLDPLAAARGRYLGATIYGGPGGPVDHRRGLGGPAPRR